MILPGLDPILCAFDRLAARQPECPLVVSTGRSMTRSELAALASGLGRRIGERLSAGPVVALAAPNGPAFLAGLLAVRRAGLAALLLDWTMPVKARMTTAAASGACLLLSIEDPWPLRPEDFRLRRVQGGAPPPEGADRAAVIKVTSGSTGAPRGVLTPSEALVADSRALTATMGLADDERILAAIPMAHSYGLSSVAMAALLRGSLLAVPETTGPFAALEAAAAQGVTFLPTVPAYLSALLSMTNSPPLPRSLGLVISAGAPLEPRVAAAFRSRYGRAVHVFYGASECGGICYDRDGGAGERGTVGTPVDGVLVELVASSGDSPGRVAVRSPAVAAGYHPPSPELGEGRFLTGDQARWRGQELVLVGRVDDLINVKGKKVNPRAIESVLRRLPGVADAAVFAGGRRAGSNGVIHAVVACDGAEIDRAAIRAFCRDRLPKHKIPRRIALVKQLPRTERGKLDGEALARLVAGRSSERLG